MTMTFITILTFLFHLFICISVNYVNGWTCYDGTSHTACRCSVTTGGLGTCNCPTSVRHNKPCAKVNGVDSVS